MECYRKELQEYIKNRKEETLNLLKDLCGIPAPSHHEDERAEYIRQWLEDHGAEQVFIDEAKNVIYPYACVEGQPIALFAAHMDTVFSDLEPMPVYEQNGKLFSPGVGDDTANLAIMLMMAAYLAEKQPAVCCGIVIAANSCEEGLGNLKGSKALVERYRDRMIQMISFDTYADRVCNKAVGSSRYKVEVLTEGGHSYEDFGHANAIKKMTEILNSLYEFVPADDGSKTTYNVGMIRGGTSVNTIAQQEEMFFEFRSDEKKDLDDANTYLEKVINEFRAKGLEIRCSLLGSRPCGSRDLRSPKQKELEEECRQILEKWSQKKITFAAGSTDCNIPFSLGIPAATVGLILGGGAHTREEWVDISSIPTGLGIAADIIGRLLL